ncbi:MAG: zf-HC2 domain-containing protein [Gemmataceae bacterium]|nr:zf-HC2 domain-containing protein [Gemmataceae bacterium]
MSCLDCQELLQRLLDGELLPDRVELDRHLAGCSECRDRHVVAQRLTDGLKLLPRPAAPEGLTAQVVAAALRERAARLRRQWRRGAALAAGLLLAALAGYTWLVPGPDEPGFLASVRPPEPDRRAEPSLREGAQDARQALAALADRIGDKLREQGGVFEASTLPLQFVSTDSLPSVGAVSQPLEATVRGLRQGTDGVSTGVQTVGGSARRALNYFFRKLPPLQSRS